MELDLEEEAAALEGDFQAVVVEASAASTPETQTTSSSRFQSSAIPCFR